MNATPDLAWRVVCSECGDPVLYQPADSVSPRTHSGPPEPLVEAARRVAHLRCVDPESYADVVFIRRGVEA